MNRQFMTLPIGKGLLLVVYFLFVSAGAVRSQVIDYSRIKASGGVRKPVLATTGRADSAHKNKPSLLTIKVFSGDISKPLTSAVAIITSRITNKVERVGIPTGQLIRTFDKPDEVIIDVSAAGYKSARRNMTIALSPQGNRYEFDAELDRTTISLTVSAVDRQTNSIIRDARFTLIGKSSGVAPITLLPDSATGLSRIELPGKGTYVLSSKANGYADFVKPIRLDSIQNEARFILNAIPKPKTVKPESLPEARVVANASPPSPPIDKAVIPSPVVKPAPAGPTAVSRQPFGPIEKGKAIPLKNIYFDQSSPTLRSESFPELDQLAALLTQSPAMQVEIRGHTDNQGDFDLNVKLSRDRCQAVVDYLVSKGIAKSRLKAVGRGPIDPIAPNTTEENRKKNRRVEFVPLSGPWGF